MSIGIVTGGRNYEPSVSEEVLLLAIMDVLRPSLVLVGDATGVDAWAARMLENSASRVLEVCRAEWEKYGRAAGPIRNTGMAARAATEPDGFCVAFTGGSGTADMVKRAHGHELYVYDFRR